MSDTLSLTLIGYSLSISWHVFFSVSLNYTIGFNNVKLYNRNLYAKTIISATDSESAKNLAHKKMVNVCSSIRFVSGLIVYYHIESVKDLNVDPPLFSSVTETLSKVTINKIIVNTDMDEAVKISMLMEQSLELEIVMFLMNHPDFRT